MQHNASIWSLQAATRRYGSRVALAATDLEIRAGEQIALVGPSGSGKSTLLRLLAGSQRPSSGRVVALGSDLAELSSGALRRFRGRVGIINQANSMLPQLSVHQNVVAGLLPRWGAWRALAAAVWPVQHQRVSFALQRVGMATRQWEATGHLSGGEQQRVAIARALVGEPQLLLADEPTASLDPTNAAQVARLVFADRNRTVLFCSHWVSLVTGLADRVIGLREGQVVLDCPPANLHQRDMERLYAGSDERR